MSVQFASMKSKQDSRLAPPEPPCTTCQPAGTAANPGHNEYCSSLLTNAYNGAASSSKGLIRKVPPSVPITCSLTLRRNQDLSVRRTYLLAMPGSASQSAGGCRCHRYFQSSPRSAYWEIGKYGHD